MRWCCHVRREEERNKNKEKGVEKEELNFLVQPREDKGGRLCGAHVMLREKGW